MTNLHIVGEAIAHIDKHALFGGRVGAEKTCLLLVDGKTIGVRVLPISVDFVVFDDLKKCAYPHSLYKALGYRPPTEEEVEIAKREWLQPRVERSRTTHEIYLRAYHRSEAAVSDTKDLDLQINTAEEVIEYLKKSYSMFASATTIEIIE